MNKQNELAGTVVLVKPNIVNDPSKKKNQVGVIVMASIENDNIMVSFGPNGHAFFSTGDVLVMRKPDDIRRSVTDDATLLPYEDYHDIMDILACVDFPQKPYRRLAVELSSKNPKAPEYTMETLAEALGLKRSNFISR